VFDTVSSAGGIAKLKAARPRIESALRRENVSLISTSLIDMKQHARHHFDVDDGYRSSRRASSAP
jgi:hypothetical protein